MRSRALLSLTAAAFLAAVSANISDEVRKQPKRAPSLGGARPPNSNRQRRKAEKAARRLAKGAP